MAATMRQRNHRSNPLRRYSWTLGYVAVMTTFIAVLLLMGYR